MSVVKVGINGFGRIGRAALKVLLEHKSEAQVVAINDLGDAENLAYLLRYDSVYGRYARVVAVGASELTVDGAAIKVFSEKEPAQLPWRDLDVDVVLEATGVFTDKAGASGHLAAGAKRVIISAPTKSADLETIMMGVNDTVLADQEIISNASCTTNCAGPVMSVLENAFGVKKAMLTTAHAYTATQELVDGPMKKDMRRGRAAALNMVPSTTGAAEAVVAALPALKGKFEGIALRVPVPVVSIADITAVLNQQVTIEEVNGAFTAAAGDARYKDVLAVTTEPTVSTDFIGDPHSAIVALDLTRVVGGDMVKVMAWYDNEWGYANRLVEQAIEVGKRHGKTT